MIKVLFVCMGNICRSPTAEGVFREVLRRHGLDAEVEVDSAGTHGYHVGEAPDLRTQRAAASRGYDLTDMRARKVAPQDMEYFDLILAMDRSNLECLRRLCAPAQHERLGLLMDYAKGFEDDEVPDPFYGLGYGFDLVIDMVEDASAGLLAVLQERLAAVQHVAAGESAENPVNPVRSVGSAQVSGEGDPADRSAD
ncbi:low molecular weight phosphotyrosine protein phosphatase [Rhodocyclus tenuis]|uniref:Low molecular weight phosphotyrosine protein phosphatase n=2 Tax=Rhodocyclus TaxID=1064 RepID=A0A6L5JU10_RHOTE|nr:low molecular weight phosphotyrosine protein phosphatase [Rhodocyclus gracilis]MRD72869.1 low molecular weight phosphotyrosine protein phosphatase [Rhodocyclus gracilis]NJA90074.1 low molecular weight phosphotyrosine protein phosphatase [Rhodocyclus gracilis]